MDNNTQLQSFVDDKSYQHALAVATKMADAEIIPEAYRKKPANILIAMDMANRSGVSVMTIMQNMYIVKGKPAFSGSYVIAGINASSTYDQLRYKIEGKGDTLSCYAYAKNSVTGEMDEGPKVTMEMAKAEGWLSNPKWKNMPDLMIRYRAAAFFGRVYAPQIMMGMHMVDEIEDINPGRYSVVSQEPVKNEELERALILISDCTTIEELKSIASSIDTSSWFPDDYQTFVEAGKAKQILLKTNSNTSDNDGL